MAERHGAESAALHAERRGLRILSVAAAGILSLSAAPRDVPLLVWNASPSSPRGLYVRLSGAPAVGDVVVARPEAGVARMAARRGYLPRGLPLVKTLAARAGDRVCGIGDRLWVNRRVVAARRRSDGAGRALPRWSQCRMLAADEVLLLGLGDPGSFDGRYFGPTSLHDVLGRTRLLWRV